MRTAAQHYKLIRATVGNTWERLALNDRWKGNPKYYINHIQAPYKHVGGGPQPEGVHQFIPMAKCATLGVGECPEEHSSCPFLP